MGAVTALVTALAVPGMAMATEEGVPGLETAVRADDDGPAMGEGTDPTGEARRLFSGVDEPSISPMTIVVALGAVAGVGVAGSLAWKLRDGHQDDDAEMCAMDEGATEPVDEDLVRYWHQYGAEDDE